MPKSMLLVIGGWSILLDQSAVYAFFNSEKPDYVFLAAAKVGGIYANNTYRADFIFENLMIEANVISAAHQAGCERVCFFGLQLYLSA